MKQRILFLVILICLTFSSLAQNHHIIISGYVFNTKLLPVNNHAVRIESDTTINPILHHLSMKNTDMNGYYADTILVNTNSMLAFDVSTIDCNQQKHDTTLYVDTSTSHYSANFIICDTNATPNNCVAHYFYHPDTAGGILFTYQFVDVSIGNPVSWTWNFGDGTTSAQQNPVHTYSAPGIYSVCLNITNATGCNDTYCDTIVADTLNAKLCSADFIAYRDTADIFKYYFMNLSIGSSFAAYFWDFGDNSTSTQQNPVHTYNSFGAYRVCLTITDSLHGNCTDTRCDSIYIDSTYNISCRADFIANPDTSNPLMVTFTDLSIGSPTLWIWDFGDGTNSNLQNPTHTYGSYGIYTVCLTISNSNGCFDIYCLQISVGSPAYYNLGGQIFTGQYPPIDRAIIYLYHVTTNPANSLILVDSTITDTFVGIYWFYQIMQGDYILKAEPAPNSMFYNTHVPTYYGDVLNWDTSTVIKLTQNNYNASIHLLPVKLSTGPGIIRGITRDGNNKAYGSPLAKTEVLLLDMTNQPVGFTYSDNNGYFILDNLAIAKYKLIAEVPGKYSTIQIIDLVNANSVDSIDVFIYNTYISINDNHSPVLSVGNVYPNPASDNANIEITLTETADIQLALCNQLGQIVYEMNYTKSSGTYILPVNTGSLAEGIYYMQISIANNPKIMKKFIKTY